MYFDYDNRLSIFWGERSEFPAQLGIVTCRNLVLSRSDEVMFQLLQHVESIPTNYNEESFPKNLIQK